MQRKDIHFLIKSMFGPNAKVMDQHEWVMTQCPFAPFTHETGKDTNPSFGISVKEDEESNFHCFTCKKKGRLHNLPARLASVTDDDTWMEYAQEIPADESLGGPLPTWEQSKTTKKREKVKPVDTTMLHLYDKAAGHWYLKERGISDEAAQTMDLRVDENDHGAERILFPGYTPQLEFAGYTGRAVDNSVIPKVRDYFGFPKRLLLLGVEHTVKAGDPIVLVEGLFDYANLLQHGVEVVASMHANLTDEQAKVLLYLAAPIIVMYDNDQAGREGQKVVKEKLGKHLPLMKVRYPKGVNDPGELTKNQLYRMLSDTRLL